MIFFITVIFKLYSAAHENKFELLDGKICGSSCLDELRLLNLLLLTLFSFFFDVHLL
jgi:hypothetical protein